MRSQPVKVSWHGPQAEPDGRGAQRRHAAEAGRQQPGRLRGRRPRLAARCRRCHGLGARLKNARDFCDARARVYQRCTTGADDLCLHAGTCKRLAWRAILHTLLCHETVYKIPPWIGCGNVDTARAERGAGVAPYQLRQTLHRGVLAQRTVYHGGYFRWIDLAHILTIGPVQAGPAARRPGPEAVPGDRPERAGGAGPPVGGARAHRHRLRAPVRQRRRAQGAPTCVIVRVAGEMLGTWLAASGQDAGCGEARGRHKD